MLRTPFNSLLLCAGLLTSLVAKADQFQMLKPGQWQFEVLEAKASGVAGKNPPPKMVCIDKKQSRKDLEEQMLSSSKANNIDCDLKPLNETATVLTYNLHCKANDQIKNSPGNLKKVPPGTTFDGTIALKKETDVLYAAEMDSHVSELKISDDQLKNIPVAQRAMVQGMLAASAGNIKFTSQSKATFVGDTCTGKK